MATFNVLLVKPDASPVTFQEDSLVNVEIQIARMLANPIYRLRDASPVFISEGDRPFEQLTVRQVLARAAQRMPARRRRRPSADLDLQIAQVLAATSEAYSFDRYGEAEWTRAIAELLSRGYAAVEVTEIMKSIHTRWAADAANRRSSGAVAEDLIAHLFAEKTKFNLSALMTSAGYAVASVDALNGGRWTKIEDPAVRS